MEWLMYLMVGVAGVGFLVLGGVMMSGTYPYRKRGWKR